MSDNVATRRRQSVADPLRKLTRDMVEFDGIGRSIGRIEEMALLEVADEIDREHERRMEDCRRNTRRVTCNYISRMVADYKRGKKWKRKEYEGDE